MGNLDGIETVLYKGHGFSLEQSDEFVRWAEEAA